MTTGHVFIARSLDGFIARPDGALDWLDAANAAGEDHGYDAFISGMDGIVMGRATYQVCLGFDPWPFAKPVIVLSSRLRADEVPARIGDRVSVARDVREARESAGRLGWRRAYVDGGATIRSFLREGAIADMVITTVPVLLGRGLPLFGPTEADIALRHLGTQSFPSGLVQSRYAIG